MKKNICFIIIVILLASSSTFANDYPKATSWINDYAGVLSSSQKQELDAILRDFEATDSTQVFVAIMDRIPGGASLEGYTNELFERWGVGQKTKDNGVLLAVFISDRKLRIEVGYGLEGELTDAQSKLIISNEIAPAFKQGNYYAGIKKGITSIIAATRGAYKGTGKSRRTSTSDDFMQYLIPALFIAFFLFSRYLQYKRRSRWSSSRRGSQQGTRRSSPPIIIFGSGGSRRRRNSSWGGGGFGGFSGGGGGFSGGGGGSSGGGGASGSW